MATILKQILTASLLTIAIALLTVPGFRSHIYFLNFVDEDDNFVIANLVSEGKRLYKDVYTQHQPLPFYLSSAIQSVAEPDNILMTVKRHREFMMLWSLIWIFLLIFKFGWPLFLVATVIELTKINLLGNLFLAESLVIYPLLYLLSYFTYHKNDLVQTTGESWFIVMLVWILIFSLAPIWPLLGIIFLYFIYRAQNRRMAFLQIFLLGLIFALSLFWQGTLLDYWHDVIYINYQFYIPLTTTLGLGESVLRAIFAPLLVFVSQSGTPLLAMIKVLSLGLIFEIFWLLKDKQYQSALTWILILFLTNIRYIDPGNTLYGAFHMLPWLSVLIFASVAQLPRLWRARGLRQLTAVIIMLSITYSSLTLARATLWDSRDPATDFYVNYSPLVDISKVVEILSRDTEQTVWVEPVLYWPYWKTGAKQYSKMINYYGWMDQTPPMKNSLNDLFADELPTIVWAKTQEGIRPHLHEYLQFSRDGKSIDLFMRKDKVGEITQSAYQELDYYRFEIK